jgi:hypothetical protein
MYNFKIIKYPNGERKIIYYKIPVSGRSREKIRSPGNDLGRSFDVSVSRTKNKLIDLVRSNNWDYFLTFTFNPDKVDRYNYDEVVKKMSVWLNNQRKKYFNLKYVVVPELHKDGAYHFHGLFSDGLTYVDSGYKDKQGRVIYNVSDYKIGFTTATRVTDTKKAGQYILKYITKDLCFRTENKRRYWASRNLNKPEMEKLYIGDDNTIHQMLFNAIKKANHSHMVSPKDYPEQEIIYLEFNDNITSN